MTTTKTTTQKMAWVKVWSDANGGEWLWTTVPVAPVDLSAVLADALPGMRADMDAAKSHAGE